MVNCAVLSCKNDSRRQTKQNSNITFHRFPKNEELLRKWVQALQRVDWEPTVPSFVCSVHFHESEMYFSKSGLRRLTAVAVPTLGIHDVSPQPRSRTKRKYRTYSQEGTDKRKKDVKKESKKNVYTARDSDSPVRRKLKKRIAELTKVSKRRRLRCNALYASLNRIRKKVSGITRSLKQLKHQVSLNAELSGVLHSCGVSTDELFRGLRAKHPTHSTQDKQYWEVGPAPLWETSPRMLVYTTSYTPADQTRGPELDVQVSVKRELASSPRVLTVPTETPGEAQVTLDESQVPLDESQETIEDSIFVKM